MGRHFTSQFAIRLFALGLYITIAPISRSNALDFSPRPQPASPYKNVNPHACAMCDRLSRKIELINFQLAGLNAEEKKQLEDIPKRGNPNNLAIQRVEWQFQQKIATLLKQKTNAEQELKACLLSARQQKRC